MATRSNLAIAEPPPHHPPRPSSPLMGALGGALSGFAISGDPIGACIGCGVRIIGLGRAPARNLEIRA